MCVSVFHTSANSKKKFLTLKIFFIFCVSEEKEKLFFKNFNKHISTFLCLQENISRQILLALRQFAAKLMV